MMQSQRDRIVVVSGAVVAVLLQVLVAPNAAIFSAVPNFLLAYALAVAILCHQHRGLVLPFALGILFDLMGGGPVGAMAFLLVLASFATSRAFSVLDNESLFMPLAVLVMTTLVVEILYGVFLIWFGTDVSVLQAIAFRALPCALYDSVVGLILYPVLTRVMSATSQRQSGMGQLR